MCLGAMSRRVRLAQWTQIGAIAHVDIVTRINKYSEIGNVSAVKMESVIQ